MGVVRTGNAPLNGQGRLTGKLTVGDPRFESLVQGLGIEGHSIHELRLFAKKIATEAGRFQIARRGGLFGARSLSKSAAERAWSEAFGNGGAA